MNIFYLHQDPTQCARYHCDKHVVKMILESAQLLSGAHWVSGSIAPYGLTHRNHPCAIWVRASLSNYMWLCSLARELCREYTHRYEKVHKSQAIIEWALLNAPNIPDYGFTMPPQAMPEPYKSEDSVSAYRNYYIGEKRTFCTWKNREIPFWFM